MKTLVYPLLTIDQLHYGVTKITTHEYSSNREIDPKVLKKATGFFYHNLQSDLLFLITNRHVIHDTDTGYFPNAINLMLHTDEHNMTQNTEYSIHLYDGTKPTWLTPNPPEADVVAIPIERNDFASRGIKYKSFASNNMLWKKLKLDIGEDILIMGYPLGIYDMVHNLPVIRGGTISSAYPIPWNRRPYFLVEAHLHEGTSGSPVITKLKESWRKIDDSGYLRLEPAFFFLGIVSSKFPDREDQKTPLELNAVYFAHIIDEMTG